MFHVKAIQSDQRSADPDSADGTGVYIRHCIALHNALDRVASLVLFRHISRMDVGVSRCCEMSNVSLRRLRIDDAPGSSPGADGGPEAGFAQDAAGSGRRRAPLGLTCG